MHPTFCRSAKNVQQDVRVDENQGCLTATGQSEDIFGPHGHSRPPPQFCEAALPAP